MSEELPSIPYRVKNIAGQEFGQWRVLHLSSVTRLGVAKWRCVCTCGREADIAGSSLRRPTGSRRCRSCAAKEASPKAWEGRDVPTERTCCDCGKTHPLTAEFFPVDNDKRRRTPFEFRCRPCYNALFRKVGKKHRDKLRAKVLKHYGGEPPCCACCGEAHVEFLTIDHVGGGGAAHRKSVGSGGVYRDIVRKGFPGGYRVLCQSCNACLGNYGFCPHRPNDGNFKQPTKTRPRAAAIDADLDKVTEKCRACHQCQKVLPLNANYFHRRHLSPDGFQVTCRACRSAARLSSGDGKRTTSAIKDKVLLAYGGERPQCRCCGEGHREFLEIDHVDGGGSKDRKEKGHFYTWLVKNGYPKGPYRLLCSNCNFARKSGQCPHEVERALAALANPTEPTVLG